MRPKVALLYVGGAIGIVGNKKNERKLREIMEKNLVGELDE